MPRTYTTSGVTIIGDGEESGVWGSLTNTNLQILDRMVSQAGAITLSGTTHTLTISDGVLSDGQYAALVFGGSPSGTNTVTITPNDAQRLFFVKNNSGETVTLTQGSGGDVSILDGRSAVVYCDGAGSGAEVVNLSTTLVTETAQDIGALTPTDGNFIVGNGTTWVAESGNTVLASLGVTATADELNTLDGITASTAELNILDGVTASTGEINLLDGVTWTLTDYNTLTSTAAELNLLDGVTWTLADYNTLTSTAAELNLLDGKSLSGSDTTIVTGTAGSNGQLAQWNADGDLVGVASTSGEAGPTTASGTNVAFTSLASGINTIYFMIEDLSLNSNTQMLIQLSTGGTFKTTGYNAVGTSIAGVTVGSDDGAAGWLLRGSGASEYSGTLTFTRIPGTNRWTGGGIIGSRLNLNLFTGGGVDVGGTVDGIRIISADGTSTFDNGTVSIRYT